MVDPDDDARRLMACLGDASRYRIVRALGAGEVCVSELAQAVSLSQSCTTRHLQALGRDGLVLRRRDGKRVLYRTNAGDPRLRALLLWASGEADPRVRPEPPPKPRPARRASAPSARPEAGPAEEPATEPAPRSTPPQRRGDLEDYLL